MENGTISNNFIVNSKLGVGSGISTPSGNIHVKSDNTSNVPIHIEQAHNSSPILKITGSSIVNDTTKTLVIDSSNVTKSIKAYRVELVDNNNTNGITDGTYYIPLYTLT